jgi:choline kinase
MSVYPTSRNLKRPPVTRRSAGRAVEQAIILAAGSGSRLNGAIGHLPKCLADINGQILIDQQMRLLEAAGTREIFVVVGYQGEAVRQFVGSRASLVHNPIWDKTNSLYSLWLCRDQVNKPTLVINCDVLAHPAIYQAVLESPANAFAYDSSSGGDPEHMKVEFKGDLLLSMSKTLPMDRAHGENVGILHFDHHTMKLLFQEAATVIESGGCKMWVAAAVEKVSRRVPIRGINIAGLPWIEIDFADDLNRARVDIWPKIREPLRDKLYASVVAAEPRRSRPSQSFARP